MSEGTGGRVMDSFEKWFGKADGSTSNDLAIEYWCRAAFIAGLRRAAEIASKHHLSNLAEAIEREAEKLEGGNA